MNNNINNKMTVEHKLKLWVMVIDRGCNLFKYLVTVGLLFSFLLFTYLSIDKISGKDTNAAIDLNLNADANIILSILNKIGIEKIICWTIIIISLFYAWIQQRLRYKKTAYLQNRIEELEKQIDPHRTSSGLTNTGETPKEDR